MITKGPCTQIVYSLAPKYLNRDYLLKRPNYTLFSDNLGTWSLRVLKGC